MAFSTLFQSYQVDGRVLEAVCSGTSFRVEKIFAYSGNQTCIAILEGQYLTHRATGDPPYFVQTFQMVVYFSVIYLEKVKLRIKILFSVLL